MLLRSRIRFSALDELAEPELPWELAFASSVPEAAAAQEEEEEAPTEEEEAPAAAAISPTRGADKMFTPYRSTSACLQGLAGAFGVAFALALEVPTPIPSLCFTPN